MKVLLLCSAGLLMAAVSMVLARPQEAYTTKWDGIDLDQILNSERLLKNYFNCVMDRGSCTPDGADLKKVLPDALKTKCAKCSEAQRQGAEKTVRFFIKNKPEMWTELEKKFDPEGIYKKENADFFASLDKKD